MPGNILYRFNDPEINTLRGALELARDKYRENAKAMRAPCAPDSRENTVEGVRVMYDRLAEQFERQAVDCERMIEVLSLQRDWLKADEDAKAAANAYGDDPADHQPEITEASAQSPVPFGGSETVRDRHA